MKTSTDGINYSSTDNFSVTNSPYNENVQVDFVDLYAKYLRFSLVLVSGFSENILDEYLSYPNASSLNSITIIYNNKNK